MLKTAPASTWTIRFGAMAIIAITVLAVSGWQSAFAQKEKGAHSSEDHAREVTSLKQAFGNTQVDLFFEMGELESQKPGLASVKFVDAVDVTGKELLRFERAGDSWLIDPDTVFAYKLHKSK
jgi:hypothetical protein